MWTSHSSRHLVFTMPLLQNQCFDALYTEVVSKDFKIPDLQSIIFGLCIGRDVTSHCFFSVCFIYTFPAFEMSYFVHKCDGVLTLQPLRSTLCIHVCSNNTSLFECTSENTDDRLVCNRSFNVTWLVFNRHLVYHLLVRLTSSTVVRLTSVCSCWWKYFPCMSTQHSTFR